LAALVFLSWMPPSMALAARPLDTEDTGTVEPGKAELELSGDWLRSRQATVWAAKGVISFGLLPRLEARFESALLALDPDGDRARAGFGDSLVGFKYRVADETPTTPALLAALTFRLPTGDEERRLGSSGVDPGVLLAIAKQIGPVIVTGNVGYVFVTRDRALDLWLVAGSVEYRAAARLSLVGEIVGKLGTDRVQHGVVLRSGAVYALSERIRLDGAVGVGISRGAPDVLMTLGLTIGLF
jgi:Putative MetA-pathway of phenol degradation